MRCTHPLPGEPVPIGRAGGRCACLPTIDGDRGAIGDNVLLVFWGAIRPEERFLHERFGATYAGYARWVRRWL
jgi:hypothetical protein